VFVVVHHISSDVSIEQVASLSSQNILPEPRLDLNSLPPSISLFAAPPPNDRQNSLPPIRSPVPAYASDDPWSTGRLNAGASSVPGTDGGRGGLNGAPSSLSGSGLPKDWWKKQEKVMVTRLGQQGFILNRYMVYQVTTEVCLSFLIVLVFFCLTSSRRVDLFRDDIRSSCSYGSVLLADTLSACFLRCLRSESGVSPSNSRV
jgi:hypothetical protein